ncbi:hypothetical protein [Nostoc sp. ChiQUE01b]|uniref:hypothetical protein n=1 Tax=Nostoc sp. ChiQUE01b TaxID=3075376 RepID=UPI002AD556EE|nr:hypothetical protein [Nostoc sp. ChiQUE01b]MDZ8258993.1 hypothetical protein [Nostoc sp. ChiQUE01b]
MAIIEVSLHQGSGKRLDSVWKGECPICKTERCFTSDYFDTNVAFAIFSGVTNAFFSKGRSYIELLNSTDAVDVIGCEQCHHPMAICPFCNIAFSTDANASIHRCPKCHSNLA